MKKKFKIFMKDHWKPVVGVIMLITIVAGLLIIPNRETKHDLAEAVNETGNDEIISDEDGQPTEVPVVEESPQVEEIKEPVKEAYETSEEKTSATVTPTEDTKDSPTEKPSVTKKAETKSEEDTISTVKPSEKTESQSEPNATVAPKTESKYIPISDGWKAEESAKGDITSAQKAALDSIIQTWKSGALTDAELKGQIISYLEEQKIDYMEVSVTSKGYALFDKVPEIDLRDGGNLYSFVACYSTGKQNPDGTNKTVCYNWSAFVF
ncbi:MAG: hypothetical protein ACERKN_09005 [Velocimicrobium sp.]